MLNPTGNVALSFSCLPAPSGARPWSQEAVPRAALQSAAPALGAAAAAAAAGPQLRVRGKDAPAGIAERRWMQ